MPPASRSPTAVATSRARRPWGYGPWRGAVNLAAAAAFALAAGAAPLPAHAAPSEVKILAFGDSLTAGFGLAPNEAFPVQLAAALKAKGRNVAVTNAGVSGDTSAGGLARFDWAIPDDTEAVILELGANDALRGIDPALTRKAMGEIVARLKARRIEVTVASVPDYAAGVKMVVERGAVALFGDRPVLLDAAQRGPGAGQLLVVERSFTREPIALALPRGDDALRLLVDRTLSRLYRSKDMAELYAAHFGAPGVGALEFFQSAALAD